MKENYFYAMLSRMKYINRWGLMRNSRSENLCEHSLEVAFIAHALGVINNKVFNGDLDPEHLAVLGMYHDTPEIITGDMPTPIKYYSAVIRDAYADVEKVAVKELLDGVPEEFRSVYEDLLTENDEEKTEWLYIKAADKISAYLKCVDERNSGNTDFLDAERSTLQAIEKMGLKEADYFMEKFAPAYMQTLDESADRN
ncbi:MAG: 5'-deoxynucleotidase [Clostridiales bacterium]|nr:5'-deoxynucleotidase [Clostridiales bacterium]MBS5877145.1 5'-deoxynucleotidase [Clostridiales bacterium]MDU0939014.1 5'-deoxynucleotidase [Clostridiales bacterium]MDU1041851.1 5'-deoxynucleotidase [Clostridiales bacterium]MDU3489475.1 5'-deoxynucleotidase [Clostridiales bacterium]